MYLLLWSHVLLWCSKLNFTLRTTILSVLQVYLFEDTSLTVTVTDISIQTENFYETRSICNRIKYSPLE